MPKVSNSLCTRKDPTGVASLNVNGKHVYNAKDKAEALNNQFKSIFCSKNLTDMPDCSSHPYPCIPDISFLWMELKHFWNQ